jgi:hypothetical protein
MESRLLLKYSDGSTEWRMPPTVPEIGDTVRRSGNTWIVTELDLKTDGVIVAMLRRVSSTAETTVGQAEVA